MSRGAQGALLDPPETRSFRSRALRWVFGWIALPGSLLLFLFAFGMHYGARHPDSGWVQGVRWVATKVFSVPVVWEAKSHAEPAESPADTGK